MFRIIVINPGSTSTEVSLFEGENEIGNAKIIHPINDLRRFATVLEQFPYRHNAIRNAIADWGLTGENAVALVIGRSALGNRETGTYKVSDEMVADVHAGKVRIEHPANLGCLLAREIGIEYGAPAFVAHIAFRSLGPLARVSGLPEIERIPAYHVHNIEAVAHTVACEMNKDPETLNLVIAHLEGGMSIAAVAGGIVVDVTNALDEGPFTMERSGSIPCRSLVEMCFSGKYEKAGILRKIRGEGGMVAYLGTNRVKDVDEMVRRGDEKAAFYLEAMCYQIAKDIGAMATVLRGKLDSIVLTGKILDSEHAVSWIRDRVRFLAPVVTCPEQEGLVFVRAALRVLRGEEQPLPYK